MSNVSQVTIGSHSYTAIDLRDTLREDVEVYPGDPKPKVELISDITKPEGKGYHHQVWTVGDHISHPHCDAPNHQNPELVDKGTEIFELEGCINQAVLIDLSNAPEAQDFEGIKYLVEVTKEHLTPWVELLLNNEAVLIRTGYDRWLEANRPHQPVNIPYFNREAANYLASFDNLKVVGTDSLTVDVCGRDQPVHTAHQLLKRKLIVESLVHLHEIPESAREKFTLVSAPEKKKGATGSPVFACALIEN